MKTDITYFYQGLWIALVGIFFTACDAASEPDLTSNSESIRVYTSMGRADSEETVGPVGEDVRSCLIFWKEEDYNQMISSTEASNWPTTPYLVAKPEYPIDYYAVKFGNPYDTKSSYPIGNDKVYVIGYAPVQLITKDNYKTLIIPENMQDGKVDFLSGDGNQDRVGCADDPFVIEQNKATKEKKQLEFCHLTAKINVEAKRAETMAQKIGIQNVEVTLKDQKVPASLTWQLIDKNTKTGGYMPLPTESVKEIFLTAPKDEKVVLTINQKVDSCYVYAEGEHFHATPPANAENYIELTMDISAELLPFKDGGWDESQKTRREWKDQRVKIKSKTGTALKKGYAYKVIITFDIWDIRLQGMEVDWYNGGKHYIPITPVQQSTKGTT